MPSRTFSDGPPHMQSGISCGSLHVPLALVVTKTPSGGLGAHSQHDQRVKAIQTDPSPSRASEGSPSYSSPSCSCGGDETCCSVQAPEALVKYQMPRLLVP